MLHKMLGAMSCYLGFNKFILDAIEKANEGLSLADRLYSLIWDKILIIEELNFTECSHLFEG